MKTASCLLLVLSALNLPAAEPAADLGQSLSSKITEVTVYADRAQVIRQASAELPADTARFVFAQLPGWIDEGSVRVTLVPAEAGQILDVQVQHTYLARPSDVDFQKAEAAVRELSDQIAALDDEKAVLEAQSKQIDAIRVFSLDKLPKDAAVREVKVGEYDQTVEFIGSSLRKVAQAKRELDKKRRDLQPEMEVRSRRLAELRQRAQLEERDVVVTVKGAAPRRAVLALSYLLPGATWEPAHELRAVPDAPAVSLASYAVVTQSTGEDWNDVKLFLSTQRSTATMKIPELEAFLVGSGHKLPRFTGPARDTFAEANNTYLTQNSLFFDVNRFRGDETKRKEFSAGQGGQMAAARRAEVAFETLQQRGTTAHFPAAGSQIVRSDARPVRVPIGRATLAAQHRIIAAPEASLNAARTVDLTNSSGQAVLPGQVGLFLDGAFLGLTECEFVAPGESFPLFLGVADQIKLSRTLDKKRSELIRSGQRTKMKVSFLVTLENLSGQQATVQLTDRVPVAESDEIKVSAVKIQPDVKPDTKGLLHWDVVMLPRQSREFRLEYTLDYPAALPFVVEAEAKKSASEAKPRAASPKAAAPLAPLRDQIQQLERAF